MRLNFTLRLVFFYWILFVGNYVVAQGRGGDTLQGPHRRVDTLRLRLDELLARHQTRVLGDTEYLKAVDSIAPLLEKEDSLTQLLSVYRTVAFGDTAKGRYRASYYTYLALNAYNLNRLGSAIYYSEKNNEARVKIGQFEKEGLSHSDLFALSVYASNKDYTRVFAKYATLRPALLALPAAIREGKVSPEQVFVGVDILGTVGSAACRARDTVRSAEAIHLMEDMLRGVEHFPAKYSNYRLLYDYFADLAHFDYHWSLKHFNLADEFWHAAIRDVSTKGFRPHLQAAYTEELYSDAVEFYFDWNKTDSVRHYLSLLTAIGEGNVKYSYMNPAFLPENKSRLLAGDGRYAEAYAALNGVYKQRDSAYYAVSSDKDNNLYALAEEENTQVELLQAVETRRLAERANITLFFVLAFLVIAGLAIFLVYRSVQQRRLLDLRLQLARNFHDEIGPMLLYANVLAKKQREAHPSRQGEELKDQLALVMDAVRNIAHDLKSSELCTITLLGKAIKEVLEKLRNAAEIDFSLQVSGGGRVLSHGQFTQLQAVAQELVSNSIKHADCKKISLRIAAPGRELTMEYSDDGKGMEGVADPGIGMQNMRERVANLGGIFELTNFWPNGYSINIAIPLV